MKVTKKAKELLSFRKISHLSNIIHTKARGKITARNHLINNLHAPPLPLLLSPPHPHHAPHKAPPLWSIQSLSRAQTNRSLPLPLPLDPTMTRHSTAEDRGAVVAGSKSPGRENHESSKNYSSTFLFMNVMVSIISILMLLFDH